MYIDASQNKIVKRSFSTNKLLWLGRMAHMYARITIAPIFYQNRYLSLVMRGGFYNACMHMYVSAHKTYIADIRNLF